MTVLDTATAESSFTVTVEGFEGPFDLLLSLIAKHKLEVTELALHQVTDDFIAHIRAQGPAWDLDEATEFLVVAATLLDLKAARLLPSGEVDDEEDLALLEARDLLFARLLQYRAYKQVSAVFVERMGQAALRHPRTSSRSLRSCFPRSCSGCALNSSQRWQHELSHRSPRISSESSTFTWHW